MTKRHDEGRPGGFTRRQALGVLGGASGAALLSANGSAFADEPTEPDFDPRVAALSLDTRLVRDYGVRYPIVSAGMAFVGLTDLAAAVSNAGGIGVYGASPEPPPVVEARLIELASRVNGPFGVDFILTTTPAGDFTTEEHLDVVIRQQVPIVVFHFDVPPRAWVERLHAAGSRVWVQVGAVDVALRAVEAGADAIIAQGRSAGGHNHNARIPTLALVALLRAALPERVLRLAAGGIADGASLVRALRAGADGAWMGTRFVAASESYAHPDYQARIAAAKGPHATTFTTRFGPEFPDQPQRVLRNRAASAPLSTEPPVIGTTRLFPGVLDLVVPMPKYSALVPTRDTFGDLEEMDMPAGSESVARITDVRPAAQIVAEVIADARAIIARGGGEDD